MKALAAIAAVGIVVVFAGGLGHLLTRIDRLRAEQRAAAAQVRLVEARLELARAELLDVHRIGRLFKAQAERSDPRVEVLERRTTALRGAIFALVRTGNASMVGDPTWEWIAWPLELAEVRR